MNLQNSSHSEANDGTAKHGSRPIRGLKPGWIVQMTIPYDDTVKDFVHVNKREQSMKKRDYTCRYPYEVKLRLSKPLQPKYHIFEKVER